MAGFPPGHLGFNLHPLIDSGTMCLTEMPAAAASANGQRDELTPIAEYMAAEINTNTRGADVSRMAEMNGFSSSACIADFTRLSLWRQVLGLGITPQQCVDMELSYHEAALMAWALLVRQDGPWDHKPKVAMKFHPRVPGGRQHWHLYGATLYFYDVWSNIHYGYVGSAAGFSDSELLDGAGLEQIVSTLARANIPTRSANVAGLRAWDDAPDRAAITMGIQLRRRRPAAVRAKDLLDLVIHSNEILKKPYAP